jgi:hypothetical protein
LRGMYEAIQDGLHPMLSYWPSASAVFVREKVSIKQTDIRSGTLHKLSYNIVRCDSHPFYNDDMAKLLVRQHKVHAASEKPAYVDPDVLVFVEAV